MGKMANLKASEQRLRVAQDRARRKKLGKPLGLTDAELDQAATVTAADVKSARAYVERYGSPRLKALLDAEPYEP